MQCPEFEQQLQLAADLRQDPPVDAEFDLHASRCADCSAKREWFVALGRMTSAFRSLPDSPSIPEFASIGAGDSFGSYDRGRLIRETFSRTSRREAALPSPAPVEPVNIEPVRRRSTLLLAGSGLAVAASIALFVTLAFLPPSQPGDDSADAALAPTRPAVSEDVAPVPAEVPALDPMAFRPEFTLSGVDGRLSLQQLRDRLTSLPSDPSMTGSLRPFTSSFGVAWETLRSALPTGHSNVDPTLDQADARGLGPIASV